MSVSDQDLLHHLSRMPLVDTAELAMITGEAHVAMHRGLACLLAQGIAGRVSHGTAHLPPSRRYYLTRKGIAEAADALGFDTPSDHVRAYPMSREWLTLLIRRMDAVATVYRLAESLSPGTDRLRAIAEYGYRRRPGHCRNIPARHVGPVAPSGLHHRSRRHAPRLSRPFPGRRPSGTAAQSHPSVGYHYQVTDYVVHPDATFWLSLALRSDPGKLPPMPRGTAKPPSSRCRRSSKVRPCSTLPSMRATGDDVPAIRR